MHLSYRLKLAQSRPRLKLRVVLLVRTVTKSALILNLTRRAEAIFRDSNVECGSFSLTKRPRVRLVLTKNSHQLKCIMNY